MADPSSFTAKWDAAARRVAVAETHDFAELIKVGGLDPRRHLRFADWSGISFRDSDLRGFDFTGARLIGCDFTAALIKGARFDQAEIDHAKGNRESQHATDLRGAQDWAEYADRWARSTSLPSDHHLPVWAVFQDAPFAPEMVVVPPGRFTMGSPKNETGRTTVDMIGDDFYGAEEPQHSVTIHRPFAVGRLAVTVAEFGVFVDKAPYRMEAIPFKGHPQGPNHPVAGLTWEDAAAYAAWLAEETGQPYRLLSESEWEYVARAGTSTPFWWGKSITHEKANFGEHLQKSPNATYDSRTVPASQFEPNPWGLYQVHGNIYEWCEDRWNDSYEGAPCDGSAWTTGSSGHHVARGGSWFSHWASLRSAARTSSRSMVVTPVDCFGVRIARTLRF